MNKLKVIILINSIMLLIALYTHIALYMPSLLDFSDREYVKRGGDFLTDELFTILIHFLNLFVFYVLNIGLFIWSFKQKQKKALIAIITLAIALMFSMHIWKNNVIQNKFIQVQESIKNE